MKLYKFLNECNVQINEEEAKQNFREYLIHNDKCANFYEIQKFIIKNKDDVNFVRCVDELKEGYVIYYGLTNNLLENSNITSEMTIYLDEEILFFINGYNSDEYKNFALDMLKYIDTVNRSKKISIKYFHKTKILTEDMFDRAIDIKKGIINLNSNPSIAMIKILATCNDVASICDLKVDFFENLKTKYGIIEETTNFYSQEYHKYDLGNFIDDEQISQFDYKDSEYYISCIGNVNKLRKANNISKFNLSNSYFITASTVAFAISKIIENEVQATTAITYNMTDFTTALWCISNQGFKNSTNFPVNISCILNAKACIKSYINNSISKSFDKTYDDYKNNRITEEKLIERIANYKVTKKEFENDLEYKNIDNYEKIFSKEIDEYSNNIIKLKEKINEMEDKIETLKRNSANIEFDNDEVKMNVISSDNSQINVEIKNEFNIYKILFYSLIAIIIIGLIVLRFILPNWDIICQWFYRQRDGLLTGLFVTIIGGLVLKFILNIINKRK